VRIDYDISEFQMTDRLAALKLFSRVARMGSFSRAGRELGLSQPSVSRIIAGLEQEIGASLLTRTTRALTLTEAGADYLERIEPILLELEEADYAARGTGELRGMLRIGLSPSFAIREVIPRLPEFMRLHPALKVDLLMDDQRQDLVGEGVDLALRMGVLTDSSATARLVGHNPRILAASPAYLSRHGAPQTPADLAGHAFVLGPAGQIPGGWTFRKDGRTVSVLVDGRLTTNANEGAVAAAVAGLGIVSTGHWGSRQEIGDGRLVALLSDWRRDPVPLHAVYAAGRGAKPAARAFTDFLIAALKA
jgi:DNA-binding transcriptional LysR family regulator